MKITYRRGLRVAALFLLALFPVACGDTATTVSDVEPSFAQTTTADAPGTYLLTASSWGPAQVRAVERAGGSVSFGHAGSGIGIATSDDPDFMVNVMASGVFSAGEADQVVEWQPPARVADFTLESVTPGDETFNLMQWNLTALEVQAAWDAGYDGTGARVAIIDGAVNDAHSDLAGQVDVACSASFVPGFAFNQDVGTFWHGSHVAGIVAAADNGIGTVGIAPGATIMGVKALHGGSGAFTWIINAILFASDPSSFPGYEGCERADIINMSLAGLWFKSSLPGFQDAIIKAVNFAASKGVLVISAAANNGIDVRDYRDLTVMPAMAGSGLAISATGPSDFCLGNTNFRRPASYSNYGNGFVTLAGPGGDFAGGSGALCAMPRLGGGPPVVFPSYVFDMVPAPCGGLIFSTCWAAGTSMAAPAAAGVAALIVGKNPGISLGKLKAQLKNSADDEGARGHDAFYGNGFVNARRAVVN